MGLIRSIAVASTWWMAGTLVNGRKPVKLAVEKLSPYTARQPSDGSRFMHLFKQHAVKDIAEAAAQIPVIDYAPYFAGEPGALARLVQQVRDACENVGFFYALNHGVPQEII